MGLSPPDFSAKPRAHTFVELEARRELGRDLENAVEELQENGRRLAAARRGSRGARRPAAAAPRAAAAVRRSPPAVAARATAQPEHVPEGAPGAGNESRGRGSADTGAIA